MLFDRAFVNGAFKGRLARPNEWRIAQNSRVFLVMRQIQFGVSRTVKDTNGAAKPLPEWQMIENFGGRQGIRTPGLIVANDALSQLS